MRLRQVADVDAGADAQPPAQRLKLAKHRLEEGALARAVGADQRDPFAARQFDVLAAKEDVVIGRRPGVTRHVLIAAGNILAPRLAAIAAAIADHQITGAHHQIAAAQARVEVEPDGLSLVGALYQAVLSSHALQPGAATLGLARVLPWR